MKFLAFVAVLCFGFAAFTPSCGGGGQAPSAPLNLTVTAGNTTNILNWQPPTSSGSSAISYYAVLRGTSSNNETQWENIGQDVVVDPTAANGTTYFYKVVAVNNTGTGPASNEASGAPTACTNPAWVSQGPFDTWNYSASINVNNNAWNGSAGPQTLSACSPSNWSVVSNQTDHQGAIETYPDTQYLLSGKTIAQYQQVQGAYAESSPHVGTAEWDSAWDTWLNNFGIEVMVWNEWTTHGSIPVTPYTTFTVDGQQYGMWDYGSSTYFAFAPLNGQTTYGTTNILAFWQTLVNAGLVPSSAVPNAVEYGTEIASTNGGNLTFPLNDVTLIVG